MTLVDAGPPGSGRAIADAVTALGHGPAAVRRVVLTHFHEDHAGGAAEPAAPTGAEVLAHAVDAAVLRRDVPAPEPVPAEWERPLRAAVSGTGAWGGSAGSVPGTGAAPRRDGHPRGTPASR
ncbi:MBL fold metallo-hydrolase [Streptomyces sp. NPDC017202]|uniref:MBL fold metallo-hydrolase n=1 Tax=Streptomyces sp. NPDC017202 TaxID=3364981 RepID=UPI00379E949D